MSTCYSLKNLNPFSLSRKVTDKTKHEMVYMLWRECILPEFYRYTCEEKNFIYLNGRDVCQPGVLEIVGEFIDQGKRNLRMLKNTSLDTRTSISTSIHTCFLKFTQHPKNVVWILKVISTSCSKLIATSR